jgi:DNA repair exonuclease SbcCD ATPase subunit
MSNKVVKYSDINKEIFDLLNSHLVKQIHIDYCWEDIFFNKIYLELTEGRKEYTFELSTKKEQIQLLAFLLFAKQDGIRIIGTCARGKFCENSTLLRQITEDILVGENLITVTGKDLEELEDDNDDLQSKIEDFNDKLKELEEKNDEQDIIIRKHEQDIQDLQDDNDELRSDVDDLKDKCEDLEARIEKLESYAK